MTPHIPHLHVGSGLHDRALTLFPVWTDARGAHGFEWRTTAFGVHELPGGAQVNRLQVHNRSAKPAPLLEGDLLEGGLQNRMSAAGRLFAPGERDDVAVYCVEARRWSGAGDHRASGHRSSPSVQHRSMRNRDSGGGQTEVWERIRRYDESLRRSETSSMVEHLQERRLPTFRPLSGQRGVLVGIGGRIVGGELYGSSTGLRARWAGILRAAQLDAELAPALRTPSSLARSFARALGRTELLPVATAGRAAGLAGELGSIRVGGMSTDWDAELVHLTAFDEAHPLLAAL